MNAYRDALEQISRLRPAGDVETCKNPRKLVEQMETIALAAIATQPATSQEGEGKLDWRKIAKAAGEHGVRYRTNAALERFLSEIAATPTPPTLSEDLRVDCGASITGADIWEALFAIYKEDVPPEITEGVCIKLASCLEWSRPSDHVMAALVAQEAAEDARADCANCEGEGMWEHCPSCSLRFGRAIDLRRAALAQGQAS